MFRRRLTLSFLFVGTAHLAAVGCARELEISEPIDATKVAVAQFDPTNAIPVLRIVPAPTGIVQNQETGDVDFSRVGPQECELPSTKSCLQFIKGGWSTSTPITVYFSERIAEASIPQGITLLELAPGAAPVPVSFTFVQSDRPAPPSACFEAFGIDADDVPKGVQIVISPTGGVKPATRYAMLVQSSETGGLRAEKDNTRVEPTALFHLLNVKDTGDDATRPVTMAGAINNPLLRQNVRDLILARVAPGKTLDELSTEEKQAFDAAYTSSAQQLYGLFTFFNAVITPLEGTPLIPDRTNVIFANTWTTTYAPVWEFDPATQKVPFPNVQLLTVTSTLVPGGLKPAVPNPTNNSILAGINATLNGFSTTSSIVMTASAFVDIASIDPSPETPCTANDCAIVMYRMNDQDMIDEASGVALTVHVINGPGFKGVDTSTITIAPAVPLDQNVEYVVGVKRGIKTTTGVTLGASQIFEFLKTPTPLINSTTMEVPETIDIGGMQFPFVTALQCSTVPTTGMLASDAQVIGTATALETLVQHQRWLPAFTALEGATPPISRLNLLMAFTYKTQDITGTIDLVKNVLLDPPTCAAQTGCWEARLPAASPRIVDTGIVVRGQAQIAQAINVVPTLCVPVCEGGAMAPQIAPDECATRDMSGQITGVHPDLAAHPLCAVATNLVTSRIGSIHKYILKGYDATLGSPQSRDPAKPGSFTPATIATPRVVDIPMWVAIPTGTTAPSRVAIFQHGLGSQKEAGFYIMNTMASPTPADPQGWATVMIDLPFHGERASDIINNNNSQPCFTVDSDEVTCTDPDGPGPQPAACTTPNGMPACDGRRDPSGTGFLGVNLFATRDNFRQGTIDQLTLLRTLRLEGTADGLLPDLDGSSIAYIGQSLGSITGGNLAAYLRPDEIEGVVLNVGGGGLVDNILLQTVPAITAPLYFQLAVAGVCTLVDQMNPGAGCQDTPGFRRFRIVAQWVLDPGDPLATSIGVTRTLAPNREPLGSENILLQMSMPDPVVSNNASRALATSYYGTEMSDWGPNFQTYDFENLPQATEGSGCHSFLLAPVCGQCLFDNICNTLGSQIQAAAFVRAGQVLERNTVNTLVETALGGTVQCDDLSTPNMNEACAE